MRMFILIQIIVSIFLRSSIWIAQSNMLLLLLNQVEMSIIVSKIVGELQNARKAAGLTHDMLAQRAGLSRMTVQRTEAGKIDPRLSTLLVMARTLGLDMMLVPKSLRLDLENFVRSGGRFLGQPSGIGAPPSLVDELLQADEPVAQKRTRSGSKP